MVLWCKLCGAVIGLREPLNDWTTDTTGVCLDCAEKKMVKPPSEPKTEDKSADADQH